MIDTPKPVREPLDLERVVPWLAARVDGLEGVPEVEQFPSGASNLTYLLSYPDRELVLRRPPPGTKARSAHDMGREFRVLSGLRAVYPCVPEAIAFCEDPEVLGADFYVMEPLRGIILRQALPKALDLSAEQTRQLCTNVLDTLVELHQLDPAAAGLQDLGRGAGYTRRQIEGWSARYRKARTPDATELEEVMAWLAAEQPEADVATVLVHNDFRFDNVVLDPEDPMRVIGVLDWEMCTLGDPLMDLGNTLAYWVQADDEMQMQILRRQPTHAPGMLSRAEVVQYYGERSGWRPTDFTFYEVYGLFRLAVVVQQIYYRFFHGQTKDKRFAGFNHVARYLESRCLRLMGG